MNRGKKKNDGDKRFDDNENNSDLQAVWVRITKEYWIGCLLRVTGAVGSNMRTFFFYSGRAAQGTTAADSELALYLSLPCLFFACFWTDGKPDVAQAC